MRPYYKEDQIVLTGCDLFIFVKMIVSVGAGVK